MKDFLVSKLQDAMNRYLLLDPESKQRLASLQNKVIGIEIQGIGITFKLKFVDSKIVFLNDENNRVDTFIRGAPLSLFRVALAKEERKTMMAKHALIEGDLDVGQEVIALFDELDIDWEELFSRWVGDVPAYHAGKILRSMQKWRKSALHSFTQNVEEYLHEEVQWFPQREALQDFFHDVDELRMNTDRLEARVKRLQQRVSVKRSS